MRLIIFALLFLSAHLLCESATLRRKRQATDPLKDQLLARATYLLERAQGEIAALRAANRPNDIATLQREEAAIQTLVNQLNAATTQAQIRQIEQQLNDAENRLEAELNRLELVVINTAQRAAIIARAEALEARAASEIAKLREEGRTLLAAQLQFEEAIIAELVRELRAARTGQQILQLERQLRALEDRIEAEMNAITHTVSDPEKDELIKQATALSENATATVEKLRAAGRTQEADTLAADNRLLTEYITELKSETVAAEVARVKQALKDAIARITAEIQKLETQPATDPERDALLKRAEDLKARAATQEYKLKAAGKEHEAATLDAEVRLIDELIAELPKAADAAELKRIKDTLKTNLDTLEAQIKELEATVVDPERDALVKRAEELKPKVQIEINALNEVGRQPEATSLDAQQKLVDELTTEAKKANEAAELTRVKAALKAALDKLEADLKKLAETPVTDAERDALIKRAEELKPKVTAEAAKQKAAGQPAVASNLEAEQMLVDELVSELKKNQNASENMRLKAALKNSLDKLDEQLKKLEEPPVADPEKDALLKRAEELKARAATDAAKLKTDGKTTEAEDVEAQSKLADELVNELKKATDPAEVTRLKTALKADLDTLEALLKKVEATPTADPEAEALIKRADETAAKIKDEIAKLKAADMTNAAETLDLEQKLINELSAQLKKATTPEEAKSLKSVLKDSLDQVDAQLKKAEEALKDDPEKDALLKRAEEVAAKAQAAITKLNTDGRTPEANALDAENKLAAALASELKGLPSNAPTLAKVKTDLKAALDKLEADIKESEKPVTNEELKQHLIQLAKDLEKKAADAIAKLKADGRTDTAELEKQDAALKALADDLAKTTTAAELKPLEQKLTEAEKALNTELERAAKPIVDQKAVAELTKRIETVALKAKEGIKKLQDAGDNADGLAFEVQLLVVLDVVLQTAESPAQVTAVKERVDQIEKSVDEQLSQIKK